MLNPRHRTSTVATAVTPSASNVALPKLDLDSLLDQYSESPCRTLLPKKLPRTGRLFRKTPPTLVVPVVEPPTEQSSSLLVGGRTSKTRLDRTSTSNSSSTLTFRGHRVGKRSKVGGHSHTSYVQVGGSNGGLNMPARVAALNDTEVLPPPPTTRRVHFLLPNGTRAAMDDSNRRVVPPMSCATVCKGVIPLVQIQSSSSISSGHQGHVVTADDESTLSHQRLWLVGTMSQSVPPSESDDSTHRSDDPDGTTDANLCGCDYALQLLRNIQTLHAKAGVAPPTFSRAATHALAPLDVTIAPYTTPSNLAIAPYTASHLAMAPYTDSEGDAVDWEQDVCVNERNVHVMQRQDSLEVQAVVTEPALVLTQLAPADDECASTASSSTTSSDATSDVPAITGASPIVPPWHTDKMVSPKSRVTTMDRSIKFKLRAHGNIPRRLLRPPKTHKRVAPKEIAIDTALLTVENTHSSIVDLHPGDHIFSTTQSNYDTDFGVDVSADVSVADIVPGAAVNLDQGYRNSFAFWFLLQVATLVLTRYQ